MIIVHLYLDWVRVGFLLDNGRKGWLCGAFQIETVSFLHWEKYSSRLVGRREQDDAVSVLVLVCLLRCGSSQNTPEMLILTWT